MTHYFTRRVFGSMRNNLLDEILSDYRAIVATLGHFRADWLLTFLGLESFPDCRPGGRLENYLGVPPLSSGAVKILCSLVLRAATNLDALSTRSATLSERWADVRCCSASDAAASARVVSRSAIAAEASAEAR